MDAAPEGMHFGLLQRPSICHDVGFVNTGDATWQVEL
jgi:hypothetical protein